MQNTAILKDTGYAMLAHLFDIRMDQIKINRFILFTEFAFHFPRTEQQQ